MKINLSNPYENIYRKHISEADKDYLNSLGKRLKQMGFRVHLKEPGWLIYLIGNTGTPAKQKRTFGRVEIRRNNARLFKIMNNSEYFIAFSCGTVDTDGTSVIDFSVSTKNAKVNSTNLKSTVERMLKQFQENFKG